MGCPVMPGRLAGQPCWGSKREGGRGGERGREGEGLEEEGQGGECEEQVFIRGRAGYGVDDLRSAPVLTA